MIGIRSSRNRIVSTIALVGGVLAASLVAVAPAAEARDTRDSRNSVGIHRGYDRHKKNHRVKYVNIPRRIHGEHWREIRHHYGGREYYRAHRHYHKIYRFPVVVGGLVTYRPYYYCDNEIFFTASAPLPRVVIGLNITPGYPIYR